MSIESDVFKRAKVNFKLLKEYGFKQENKYYIFEKNFLNKEFKAIIKIDDKGNISGKVIDLQVNEEYLGLKTEMTGDFVNSVREEYKAILIDIKNNCFDVNYFIFDQTNRINKYIIEKYNDKPEFLWEKFPGFGIYRNKNNNKWYAAIMNIDRSKLDNGSGEIEIINLKLERQKINQLLKQKGFYQAYHMNKKDWISIILNDTLEDNIIVSLIDESYNLIKG